MRAVVVDAWGGVDRLRVTTVPDPIAGPGQVVVRVAYAGVNPADWKCREGWLASYFEPRFPFVLGFDAAGRIAAVGRDVTGLAVGDRVVAIAAQGSGDWGTYAELVAVPADLVVPLPSTVEMLDASVLPTAATTAHRAVVDVAAVETGQKVFVHGAAGGTGSYALQLARMAGAAVAASCGPANVDYVRALGADFVIDYRAEDIPAALARWAPEAVDAVIDCVGQGTLLESVELTRPAGVVAAIGTLIADERRPEPQSAAARAVRYVVTMSNRATQPASLRALIGALADGQLRSPAIEVLDLGEVAEAHRRVQAGHVRGKLALCVGGKSVE